MSGYYWVYHITYLGFNVVCLGPLLQAKDVVLPLLHARLAAPPLL
jgi:hypothetical protein